MINVEYDGTSGPADSPPKFDRNGYFLIERNLAQGGSRVHMSCKELSDKIVEVLKFDSPTGIRIIKKRDFSKGQNPYNPHSKAVARKHAAELYEHTKALYLHGVNLSELVLL